MITIDMVTGEVTTTPIAAPKAPAAVQAPVSTPEPALQPHTIDQAHPAPMPAPLVQVNIEKFIHRQGK